MRFVNRRKNLHSTLAILAFCPLECGPLF